MKVEIEICSIEKSVLIEMVKNILFVFAIENDVVIPDDKYIRENLSDELGKIENLGLISYYKVSSLVEFGKQTNKQNKGQ